MKIRPSVNGASRDLILINAFYQLVNIKLFVNVENAEGSKLYYG